VAVVGLERGGGGGLARAEGNWRATSTKSPLVELGFTHSGLSGELFNIFLFLIRNRPRFCGNRDNNYLICLHN